MLGILAIVNSRAAGDIGLKTVVIDAGHGGTDPGAVSPDRYTYEKSLTLDISKRLARKINAVCPEVKVVLSRPDDKFVALDKRAECANKENADLFVSIHINSCKSASPNGYSVHVLGQSSNANRDLFAYNMDVCKRENSVIMLENDYSTKYQGFDPSDPESFIFMQLIQNSHLEQSLEFAQIISESLESGPIKSNKGIWQNPFLVLWKTAMPAVLVELGFLSNSGDLAVLRNEASRDKIADCLCEAFNIYKKRYDSSVNIDAKPDTPAVPVQDTVSVKKPEVPKAIYGTQIMAGKNKLSPKDKHFLGYEPTIYEVGGIYKYIIGCSESEAEAREKFKAIRKTYPSAFLVKISNGVFPVLQ